MLGDVVKSALSTAGITEERVEQWLGKPCGCESRKNRLNALNSWAMRIVGGKLASATVYLAEIMSDADTTNRNSD